MQVNPVEGETVDVRDTVPVNALIDVTVIMVVPEVPAVIVTPTELSLIVKSGTATL